MTQQPHTAPTRPIDSRGRALVTGATSGIGLELARLLAADGYDLLLAARSEQTLKRLADELTDRHGVRAEPIVADLSEPGSAAEVMRRAGDGGGPPDVVVNNAGVGLYGEFTETEPAAELAMLQLNVASLTELTKLAVSGMRARGSGRVLNVASTAAFQPGPLMAVYYASKAYVLSFGEAVAEELRGTGVTVTTLCPGATPSGFQATAGLPDCRLLRAPKTDPAVVAKVGYRAMQAGKPVVVAGALNKLQVQALRATPRRITTKLVRWVQEPLSA